MRITTITRIMAALAITASLGSLGFQCSSPNVTSGKMYLQQYESSKDITKLDKALEVFQKETQANPGNAEAWYWMGYVQGLKKDYSGLATSWDHSQKAGPMMKKEIETNRMYFFQQAFNNGAKTYDKAQLKNDPKLFDDAANSFRAATVIAPDSAARYNGYINLALVLLNSGKYAEAQEPLEKQIALNPQPQAYRLLALMHTQKGADLKKNGSKEEALKEYQKAIEILQEGIRKFPEGSAELNNEMLNIYIAADRASEAVETFKKYADENPANPAAQYAAGTVLLQVNRYEDATVYLLRAAELQATDPKADIEKTAFNLTVAYLKWSVMQRDAEAAKSNDPNAPQNTAFKETVQKAVPWAQKLTTINPNDPTNWDLATKVYAAAGMAKEAEAALNKADELKKKK